jgi:hypothetical protein
MANWPRFYYTDSQGVERTLHAQTLWQAQLAVQKAEAKRSGSIAAAEIAARSVRA